MLVFVYGTLTDPSRATAVLGDGDDSHSHSHSRSRPRYRGHATLEGLHRVDGQYPTLAPGGRVEGRLLAVSDDGLAALDAYEGVEGGLYARVQVPIRSACGDERSATVPASESLPDHAWVYVGNPDRLGLGDIIDWGPAPFSQTVRDTIRDQNVVIYRHE